MHTWFQNLNDRQDKLFHFRGSLGSDYRRTWFKYEITTGPSLKLKYQHGEADDGGPSSMLIIGFLYFTLYLTFYLPESWYFKRKCVATWDGGREFYLTDGRMYGFYFHEWAFVWSWHAKPHESSSRDPWWMRQYIHLDNLVLGKPESIKDELCDIDNVKFKLGEKEFVMDSIKWVRYRRFRRFIPYSIYNKHWLSVDMKIDKPPMVSGKGENSWDCGDDGIFGSHQAWPYKKPDYLDRDKSAELAVGLYVDAVFRDAKRYGGSSSERGINKNDSYKYLGRETNPTKKGAE